MSIKSKNRPINSVLSKPTVTLLDEPQFPWGVGVPLVSTKSDEDPWVAMQGFSSSNRYEVTGGPFPGSTSMTRILITTLFSFDNVDNVNFFNQGSGTSGTGGWAFAGLGSGGNSIRFRLDGVNSPSRVQSVSDVGALLIYHATFDGSLVRMYVNGVEIGSGTAKDTYNDAGTTRTFMGTTNVADNTDMAIIGAGISDTTAMSASEISDHVEAIVTARDMVTATGLEHMYSAKEGLHIDQIGSEDWDIVGTPVQVTFAALPLATV